MNDIGIEIIPILYHMNDASPTEDKIVKIYNNGDVEFFIKCGDLGFGNGDETQYTYCKFSFKVSQSIYRENYNSVDDFVKEAIEDKTIKDLTVSVIKPTADLNDEHFRHVDNIKLSSNTKIEDILNDMKFIGGQDWTTTVAKILVRRGQKKDAIKFLENNFQEIMEFMENIKNEELTQLKNEKQNLKLRLNKINEDFNKQLKEREKEHAILLNKINEEYVKLLKEKEEKSALLLNKNQELKQQLEEKDEVLKQLDKVLKQKVEENKGLVKLLNKKDEDFNKQLNKKNEEYNKVLEDNQGLGKLLKEKEKELTKLTNTGNELTKLKNEKKDLEKQLEQNEEFNKLLEENQELKQQLEKINKDLKDPLYKKKDKGFLSIFSCCTCGLDNVAEMEEGKDEMNINS